MEYVLTGHHSGISKEREGAKILLTHVCDSWKKFLSGIFAAIEEQMMIELFLLIYFHYNPLVIIHLATWFLLNPSGRWRDGQH